MSSQVRLTNPSYTADLIMELQHSSNGRDWDTVKSWDTSADGLVSLEKNLYVSPGYSYRIYATADVYTSSGTFVESAPTMSLIVDY